MSPPALDGSRTKVQRAKEHFQDLVAKAVAFQNLNPYGVVIEHNPETGERIWRARVSRPIPPEWSLIIGDVIHNLRAALDYLAWDLEGSNGHRPSRSTQFPVWDKGAKPPTTAKAIREHKERRERQVLAFGEPAMALIERLQPDSRRDRDLPNPNPLGMLHQLDIWDKHKLLTVVGGTVRQTELIIGGPGEDVHIDHMEIGTDPRMYIVPVADGTELLRIKFGEDTPNVQMSEKFGFFVAFAKDGPGEGKPVLETCDKLISFVDETLTLFAGLP